MNKPIKYGHQAEPEELYPEEVAHLVGKGWEEIVLTLIKDLLQSGWNGRLSQIKEKFGGLRFYANDVTSKQDKIIFIAENQSLETCEVCGNPGTQVNLLDGHWVATRCKDHK